MNIGIIGAEAKKFTDAGQAQAHKEIARILLHQSMVTEPIGPLPTVVSGRCHLGGVDVWAEEAADALKLPKAIFPPKVHTWEAGYKPRNIQIAKTSDVIYVIVVSELPADYEVEDWNRKGGCYHCDRPTRKYIQIGRTQHGKVAAANHVKSGACWTAWYAIEKLGKQVYWIVIDNAEKS